MPRSRHPKKAKPEAIEASKNETNRKGNNGKFHSALDVSGRSMFWSNQQTKILLVQNKVFVRLFRAITLENTDMFTEQLKRSAVKTAS